MLQDTGLLQRPWVSLLRLSGCHPFACLRGHSSAAKQRPDPAALAFGMARPGSLNSACLLLP